MNTNSTLDALYIRLNLGIAKDGDDKTMYYKKKINENELLKAYFTYKDFNDNDKPSHVKLMFRVDINDMNVLEYEVCNIHYKNKSILTADFFDVEKQVANKMKDLIDFVWKNYKKYRKRQQLQYYLNELKDVLEKLE